MAVLSSFMRLGIVQIMKARYRGCSEHGLSHSQRTRRYFRFARQFTSRKSLIAFFLRYSSVSFVQWEKSLSVEILLTESDKTSTLFISRSTETFSSSLPHKLRFLILERRSVLARRRIRSPVSIFPILSLKTKNFKNYRIFLKISIYSCFTQTHPRSDNGSSDSKFQTHEVCLL